MRLLIDNIHYRGLCFKRNGLRRYLVERMAPDWRTLDVPGPQRIFVADRFKAALNKARPGQTNPVA